MSGASVVPTPHKFARPSRCDNDVELRAAATLWRHWRSCIIPTKWQNRLSNA